jgi:LysR family glycine cleavage system transcriptional activator
VKYFWLQYPEIDLCLFHAHAAVDFEREEIDIAVTYGKGAWSGVVADKLLSLDFFPVCSPAFLRNDKPLTSIDNLHYYTLLHDANYECWRDWLKLAGLNDIQADKGTIIDDTNVLIQAALDGQDPRKRIQLLRGLPGVTPEKSRGAGVQGMATQPG